MNQPRTIRAILRHASLGLIASLLLVVRVAWAGGGPENVLLVVNVRSWSSLTIANHFIQVRRIPSKNVVYLDWSGALDAVDITEFREKLLKPIFAAINDRGLAEHIDYIIYSSDFPWSVDANSDVKGAKLPPPLTPVGSLNSATYFAPAVLAAQPSYLTLDANRYAQLSAEGEDPPSQAFRAWYGWDSSGARLEAGGQSYFLSTMLGVTSGRGNSVAEAVDYLTRSAGADGSRPEGTVYFMTNDDVRSKTRAARFASAVRALEKLDVAAEILTGAIPQMKPDVQGCMIGSAEFSWGASGSTIRPGAICEHLTSLGGVLRVGASQTPLTQLLGYGAAGASGTVVEPFALQAKFPLPCIHVHYARGCSLAESFYQSVSAPFQLLIVGEPLCQPWAVAPTIHIVGLPSEGKISGNLTLSAKYDSPSGAGIDRFEWYLDGGQVAITLTTDAVTINTARLVDGAHELRVVAAEKTPIETQGRAIATIMTANHDRSATLARTETGEIRWGEPISFTVNSPGALAIAVMHHDRVLARVTGEQGVAQVDSRALGLGPVVLRAAAVGVRGPESNAISMPLELTILAPARATPLAGRLQLKPGFEVLPAGAAVPVIVQDTASGAWLAQAGVAADGAYVLNGVLQPSQAGTHQLVLRHSGSLQVEINDQPVYSSTDGQDGARFVPVSLARGSYRVRVSGQAKGAPQLEMSFGLTGTRRVDGELLLHETTAGNAQNK